MGGEALPKPFYAEGRLAEIVQKACAYDPKERYSSPALMRQELEAILYDEQDAELIYPSGDELALAENQYASHTPEPQMGISEGTETERTESVFSGGGNAVRTADAFEDSRTESVFGHQTPDGTERTESVFHKPAPKKMPEKAAASRSGEKSRRGIIIAVAASAYF